MSSANAHVRILRTVGEGGLYWMYTVQRCRAYVVSYVGIVCPVSCHTQVSLQEKNNKNIWKTQAECRVCEYHECD